MIEEEDFGPDLIISAGDCEFSGRCSRCLATLGSIRPDQSLDLIGVAWDRHVNVDRCNPKLGFFPVPAHARVANCPRLKTDEGCYWCCSACNFDRHTCRGCGDPLTHLGNELLRDGTVGGKHEGCCE